MPDDRRNSPQRGRLDAAQIEELRRAFDASTGSLPQQVEPPSQIATALAPAAAAADVGGALETRVASGRAPPSQADMPEPAVLKAVAPLWVKSNLGLRKFVDPLVRPTIIRPSKHHARCPLRIRASTVIARLHQDLPLATFWGYDGKLPGPAIEVDSGQTVLIEWVNDLQKNGVPAALPFDVVRVPAIEPSTGAINANLQEALTPGGFAGDSAGAVPRLKHSEHLTGFTVVHLHGAMTTPVTTVGRTTSWHRAIRWCSSIRTGNAARRSGITITRWR